MVIFFFAHLQGILWQKKLCSDTPVSVRHAEAFVYHPGRQECGLCSRLIVVTPKRSTLSPLSWSSTQGASGKHSFPCLWLSDFRTYLINRAVAVCPHTHMHTHTHPQAVGLPSWTRHNYLYLTCRFISEISGAFRFWKMDKNSGMPNVGTMYLILYRMRRMYWYLPDSRVPSRCPSTQINLLSTV